MNTIKSNIFDIYLKSGKVIKNCESYDCPDLNERTIVFQPLNTNDPHRQIQIYTDQIAAISAVMVTGKEGQPLEPLPLELS